MFKRGRHSTVEASVLPNQLSLVRIGVLENRTEISFMIQIFYVGSHFSKYPYL